LNNEIGKQINLKKDTIKWLDPTRVNP
jgi:hypothetical protein